jgi:FkbM family methyltransferase
LFGVHGLTAETSSTSSKSLFNLGLSLYRKTIKRVRPLHEGMHWLTTHSLIPILETKNSFHTMPDDPLWFRFELLTNRHEMETTAQIRQLVKSGMTVLDVGGHVGYYTRMTSQLVGDSGRVIAFEPHPRNNAMLNRNTGHLKNVIIEQVALGDQEGIAELYDYLMMSASGSLHFDEKIRDVQRAQMSDWDVAPRAKDFEPQKYSVRLARVDDILAKHNIQKVDVVKMDIEGAEMGALRGMKNTIASSPNLALVMEYNPLGLEAFGNEPVNALEEVLSMGFKYLYVIEADGSLTDYTHKTEQIQHLTAQLVKNMGVVNLLFKK